MDYLLEQLGDERFQQLCQALLIKEHPTTQCFPVSQPDGGRDAIAFLAENNKEVRPFVVFQVKYVRDPFKMHEPHKWLLEVVRGEASKIAKLVPKGASSFILLTNIPGTAHAGVGSIDLLQKILDDNMPVPSQCWWRDDMTRRLDDSWDIKWSYPEVMSGTDVLRFVIESGVSGDVDRRNDAMRAFIQTQMMADSEVRFKQIDLQNDLLELFVDVPLSRRIKRFTGQYNDLYDVASGTSFPDGEEILFDAAELFLQSTFPAKAKNIVLEGGPGQGKSTVVQFVGQVHRLLLLNRQDLLRKVPDSLIPKSMCLPIKADLRDFATWLDGQDPFTAMGAKGLPVDGTRSLDSFISALIRFQSGGFPFSVADLHAVCRVSSVLLILDGLDEVANLGLRAELVKEIRTGVERLRANAASLQVVVTSRPAALSGAPGLPEDSYYYFSIGSLTPHHITEYTERWIKAKRLNASQASEIRQSLPKQVTQPHLRELARNPMQLAILLGLIHTRGSSLPRKRTALYDSYVNLFFDREAEKNPVVRDNRAILIDLHQFLGWTLHSEVEARNHSGRISEDSLRQHIRNYLERNEGDSTLVDQLFSGVVERLVFLVSRLEGTFEFEVQPVREYFAARHLYETAPYSPPGNETGGTKPDRFNALASNFFWLNAARFYAGCYSKGELSSLVGGIKDLANEDDFRLIGHPYSLAAVLLSDQVFSQDRRSMKEVLEIALHGVHMRHVQSSSPSRNRIIDDVISLPSGEGKDELIEFCSKEIQGHLPYDKAQEVSLILQANLTHEELSSYWVSEALHRESVEFEKWVLVGARLGVLQDIDDSFLLSKLDHLVNPSILASLCRSGKEKIVNSNETWLQGVVRGVLRGEISYVFGRKNDSILAGLFSALDPMTYLERWRTIIAFDEDHNRIDNMEGVASVNPVLPLLEKCDRFVREANRVRKDQSPSHWAHSLESWDIVVEACRREFGESWAAVRLANFASAIVSTDERASGFNMLLDHERSLCQRMRYGRMRTGSATYWISQFHSAVTEFDLLIVCLNCMTWCREDRLAEMRTIVDGVLSSLSDRAWRRLAQELTVYNRPKGRHGMSSAGQITDSLRFDGVSPRMTVLLASRASRRVRQELYVRNMKNYVGSDAILLDYFQSEAVSLAVDDESHWEDALKAVKMAYSKGVVLETLHPVNRQRASATLSQSVARAVATDPESFPRSLLSLADDQLRSYVARRIVSVEAIARRDAWDV